MAANDTTPVSVDDNIPVSLIQDITYHYNSLKECVDKLPYPLPVNLHKDDVKIINRCSSFFKKPSSDLGFSDCANAFWIIFAVLIGVFLAPFFINIIGRIIPHDSAQSISPQPTSFSFFRADVMSQVSDKDFQLRLLSAAKSLEERVPPTILFASDKSNKVVVGNLANTAMLLFKAYYNLAPVTYAVKESNDLAETSTDLRSAIGNVPNEKDIVYITGIEKMTGWTPTCLHELVDKDMAPFRNVVFLLAVEDDLFGDLEDKKCDNVVASFLNKHWYEAGLTQDRVGGVVTRIIGRSICVS